MFDVGWPELLVIAIVLIVVVGPQDLPRMLRAFGKATAKMRTMAGEFRTQFDEALKEADLDDVRKTISDAQNLNPTKSLRDAMNPLRQVGEDIRSGLNDAVKPGSLTKPDETESTENPVKKSADIGKPAAALNGAGTADAAASSTAATNGEATSKPRKAARATSTSSAKANGKAVAAKGNGKAPKPAGTKGTSKSASVSKSAKVTAPKAVGEAAPATSKSPAARTRKTSVAKAAPVKKAASRRTARKSGDEADT